MDDFIDIPGQPFNMLFCAKLMFCLTDAFANSPDENINRFWCDGIFMPSIDNHLSKKYINSSRMVLTKAVLGPDRRDVRVEHVYDATILFGSKSLSRYARDLSLIECLPDAATGNWFEIDIENKAITIQLK